MQAEREVVRFLSAYQAIWHAHFPSLFRRAQWHIVTHLCTSGREGAAVGELYGLVKQVFLLDDSTVKERILEIKEQKLCIVDPADAALSARSVVVPTPALLELFDRHLVALARNCAPPPPRSIRHCAPRRRAKSTSTSGTSSCNRSRAAATPGARRSTASSMR